MSSIIIFESYHKDSVRIKNSILTPIHVGRDVANEKNKKDLVDIIGDNTGDNISFKNPNYCELTAQYWAWKNCTSDYIGFMHYRRHLNFNINCNEVEDEWGVCSERFYSENYIKRFGMDEQSIINIVENYDIVTVKTWDVRNANSKSNYDHYANSDKKLHISDYDMALDILREKYPEYKSSIEKYNADFMGYYTNIFIMKSDIFNEYCNWLFSILFELEKKVDISKYDFQEARIFGYISEWLFGIFLTKKKEERFSIIELQRTFIQNTDKLDVSDIHICMSCDDRYSQHIAVAIASILKNKNIDDKLHIYILDGGISELSKRKILSLKKSIADADIQFISINESIFKDCPLYTIKDTHLSLATYYRLIISELFPHLDKILYLDCDLITRTSLYELYHTELNDMYFMGVWDILHDDNVKRLNIKKYVSAGVILINLKKWREDKIQDKLFEFVIVNRNKILYHDQDVLNCVLQDHMDYLDKTWNAQTCEYKGAWDGGWNELGKSANIVHFISDRKPWAKGNRHPFRNEYYKYLSLTPWKNKALLYFLYKLNPFIIRRKSSGVKINLFFIQIFKKYNENGKKRISILGVPVFSMKKKDYTKSYRVLFIRYRTTDKIQQCIDLIQNDVIRELAKLKSKRG